MALNKTEILWAQRVGFRTAAEVWRHHPVPGFITPSGAMIPTRLKSILPPQINNFTERRPEIVKPLTQGATVGLGIWVTNTPNTAHPLSLPESIERLLR